MSKMNGWLKNGKIYSLANKIKEKGKQVIATFLVFVTVLAAPLVMAGCNNNPPDNTDTGIVDTSTTDTQKPGDTETPGTETPGNTDTPGTENPGNTDQPGTENPGTDNPGTETPGTDNPGTENPGTETPGTENPGTENPGTENPGTDTPGTDNPGQTPDEPVTPPVEDDITLEEFLADNGGTTASNFAADLIDDMTNYADMKAVSYSYVADEGKITSINVAYVVDGQGTERQLKQAEINIVGGVEMQDIIDGTAGQLTTTTETTGTLLTFDAKEEANKGSNSTIQAQIDEAIDNALGDDAQDIKTYQTESFSATVADWAEANKEQINQFMNSNYLTTFAKKAVSLGFNADKIQKVEWIFGGEENINSIKLMFTYKTSDTNESIRVVSYNFDQPINGEDFLKTVPSITASELKSDYSFAYNPTIQGTRDDLVNALFKAVGVNEISGTRYLKDNGILSTNYGHIHTYTIVEVSGDEVKEYSIEILTSTGNLEDSQAIEKLANSANYKVYDSKVIDISGASVEYVAQAAKTLSAKTGTTKRMIITTSDGKQFMV